MTLVYVTGQTAQVGDHCSGPSSDGHGVFSDALVEETFTTPVNGGNLKVKIVASGVTAYADANHCSKL